MPSAIFVISIVAVIYVSVFVLVLAVIPSGESARLASAENGMKLLLLDRILLPRKKVFLMVAKKIFP